MSRNGAQSVNLATGETENISSREAEADVSSPKDAAAATANLTDHAAAHHKRCKAKKASRKDRQTYQEGEAARQRPSSRLQFTEKERTDSHLQKAIKRSDKAADKLDTARENIPKKKKLIKKRTYDKVTGKGKTRLKFEETEKPSNGKIHHNPIFRPVQEVRIAIHSKIREVEHDNSGVEAGHLGERTLESSAEWTNRRIRGAYRHHRLKPWREVKKAEQAAHKANIKFRYEKAFRDNPQATSNPISRLWQKQRIKKSYAKEVREAGKTAKKTITTTRKAAAAIKNALEKTASFVASNWRILLPILLIVLLVLLLAGGMSSCSNMLAGGMNAVLGTTYTAEDEDINGANEDYTGLENNLRNEIDNVERTHPGYDEYRYNLDEIGHDPYELTSYLTVLYEDYTREEVQAALRELFKNQYLITYDETIEVRYRTETYTDSWTDEDGNSYSESYTVEVPYDYYILTINLRNKSVGTIAKETLTSEQYERYLTYMETRGGRNSLFPDNPSMSGGVNTGEYTDYDIPPEALTNATFRKLITEAEKYLGYPYVWGGSSPSTSFDCSGFVCWVLKNSGVYPMGRTTAEGIRQQCAIIPKSEAKPGDIIFFQGTYNTSGASHVGIYVGDGMMIHCGNPIQYANINSNYWSKHFMCYGRLNYNN